jgi:ABC-type multidrug transport system fused ATPase/permease subunit
MDECTASVDTATDERIQRMVREIFAGCTVLCIAHRLATIVDYDRIAVLDHGALVEFGAPAALVDVPEGFFAGLVRDSGAVAAGEQQIEGSGGSLEPPGLT